MERPKSKFDAPYFVTWYITLWNVLYLPIYLIIHSCFLGRRSKSNEEPPVVDSAGSSIISNAGPLAGAADYPKRHSLKNAMNQQQHQQQHEDEDSIKKILM